MTLADFIALRLAGNAHVRDGVAPAAGEGVEAFWARHDSVFLWRVSVDYMPDPNARESFIQRVKLHRLSLVELHTEIYDYLRDTFADRPRPVRVTGDSTVPITIAASFAACWIHDFAGAYGWTDAHTLSLPLARIFQLRQLLRIDALLKAGKTPMPAGDDADLLAAAAFAEIAALDS